MTLSTHKDSPVYEAVQKNGLKKFWQIRILVDDQSRYYTQTSHWSELQDGSLSVVQTSEPYEAVPVNIGKANETTALQQAELEYESTIKKQRDKKQYMLPGEDRSNLRPLPMLAHPYDKHYKKLVYPLAAQIKYDGHRMAYRTGEGWTRGGQDHISKVIHHLHFDTEGHVFDGELLLPGLELLQKTASAVKKYQKGLSDQLQYIVYDVFCPDMTYAQRQDWIEEFFAINRQWIPSDVVLAPTTILHNEAEVQAFFVNAVSAGHEGIILRNLDGRYLIKDRSYDLQKYKPFIEEEFEIVDIVPMGGGSAAKLGKFVLRAANGETFEAAYKADNDARAQLLKDGIAKYREKYAQTRYPNLSEAGVPQHSRVVDIRDSKTGGV